MKQKHLSIEGLVYIYYIITFTIYNRKEWVKLELEKVVITSTL